MSDHIILIGAEDVRIASNAMQSAAESMQRAASSFDYTADRLIRALEAHQQAMQDLMERVT